jgi:hypothetical protein
MYDDRKSTDPFTMKKLTAFFFLAVISCSCSHYYYVPNVQNVPLFREKNEYRLSGTYGSGSETSCLEVQGAYSVTKNFGVMTNFMSAKGIDNSGESWAKGNYLDAAIGYFKPLHKSGVFEIYGGIGGSKQHHQYRSETDNLTAGTSDLSFLKIFIQPSVGMTFNAFDIAFSTRLNRLSFTNIDNQIIELSNGIEFDRLNEIAQTKTFLFIEPALTIRGGWKYVKVQLQGSLITKEHYHFAEYHVSIGINIAIAKRYLKDVSK